MNPRSSPDNPPATTAADLMAQLDFTAADLAANREGQLSPRQIERLQRLRRRTALLGGGLVIALIFVATVFLFLGQQGDSQILTLVGIGVTITNVVLMSLVLRSWLRLGEDLQRAQALAISGKVQRVIRASGRRVTHYVLRVGEVSIPVSRDTLKSFEHEAYYRVYRTPFARVLLSAERLS